MKVSDSELLHFDDSKDLDSLLLPLNSKDPINITQNYDCLIEWLSWGLVIGATLPQGPLGGMFFYSSSASLVENQQDENPWLFYLVISVSLIAAALLSAMTVNARAKVLNPFVTSKVKDLVQNPSRCHNSGEFFLGSLNLIASANISFVFAGLNLSGFDLMNETCDSSLGNCSGFLASGFIKTPFVLMSLTMNMLLFYGVQKGLTHQVIGYCQSAYRYYRENDVYSLRKLLDKICQSLRKKVIDKINIKLTDAKYNNGINILDLKNKISAATSAINENKFQDSRVVSLLNSYFQPSQLNKKIKTPFINYLGASLGLGLGMMGLWNFFFLQEIAIKFLLQEVLALNEDSADSFTSHYLNYGGKHLMVLNMGAFYFNIIVDNILNFLNKDLHFNIDRHLPKRGNSLYKFWVVLLATIATLPNIGATSAALEDANISGKSLLGWFLMLTSLLGPMIMEICGIHADYSNQALKKAKANFSEDEQEQFQVLKSIEDFQAQLQNLSSEKIKELQQSLPPDLQASDEDENEGEDYQQNISLLRQCLIKLSCCTKPKNLSINAEPRSYTPLSNNRLI